MFATSVRVGRGILITRPSVTISVAFAKPNIPMSNRYPMGVLPADGYKGQPKRRKVPNPENFNKPQYKWNFAAIAEKIKDYTHKPLQVPRLGGRDPKTGRKVNQQVGGGIKWDYFLVDNKRQGPSEEGKFYEEKVLEIRRDPNRANTDIALVAGTKGRRWILATSNMKVDQIIQTSQHIPKLPVKPVEGNAYPIGALPVGTLIHNIEMYPGQGGRLMVHAGCAATVSRRHEDMVVVSFSPTLRSPTSKGKQQADIGLRPECMVCVGRLANVEHIREQIGGPREMRRMGIRPRSGQWHRKDQYCGRKGRPLLPMRSCLKPPEAEQGTFELTLTSKDWNAEFGPKKLNQFLHN